MARYSALQRRLVEPPRDSRSICVSALEQYLAQPQLELWRLWARENMDLLLLKADQPTGANLVSSSSRPLLMALIIDTRSRAHRWAPAQGQRHLAVRSAPITCRRTSSITSRPNSSRMPRKPLSVSVIGLMGIPDLNEDDFECRLRCLRVKPLRRVPAGPLRRRSFPPRRLHRPLRPQESRPAPRPRPP
jgi:hypothetical protein